MEKIKIVVESSLDMHKTSALWKEDRSFQNIQLDAREDISSMCIPNLPCPNNWNCVPNLPCPHKDQCWCPGGQ